MLIPRASWANAWLSKFALKTAFGSTLAMGVLGAGQAQAIEVTVNQQVWDVTTFTGTYSDNSSKFNTPEVGGMMPWWGNKELAGEFSTALFGKLGAGEFGPYFAFGTRLFVGDPGPRVLFAITGTDGTLYPSNSASMNVVSTWAVARSVPGPLPILGVAAAFGFSRKLRERIKLHKETSDTATSPGA